MFIQGKFHYLLLTGSIKERGGKRNIRYGTITDSRQHCAKTTFLSSEILGHWSMTSWEFLYNWPQINPRWAKESKTWNGNRWVMLSISNCAKFIQLESPLHDNLDDILHRVFTYNACPLSPRVSSKFGLPGLRRAWSWSWKSCKVGDQRLIVIDTEHIYGWLWWILWFVKTIFWTECNYKQCMEQ